MWYLVISGQKRQIGATKEAGSPYSYSRSRVGDGKSRCLTFAEGKTIDAGMFYFVCEAIHEIRGWTETFKRLKVIVKGDSKRCLIQFSIVN